MKRSGTLRRGARLMRTTRVRPVNRERRAQAFARNFGDEAGYVRGLPCLVAVKLGRSFWSERGSCAGQMVAMHVVSRGAGGGRFDLVGACSHHHDEAHAIGVESFAAKYGLNLRAEADRIAASHAPPLGIRGLAQRWAWWRLASSRSENGAVMEWWLSFDSPPDPLDDYGLDALLGWVRRECEREADRRRPPDTLAAHVAKALGLDESLAAQLLDAAEVHHG